MQNFVRKPISTIAIPNMTKIAIVLYLLKIAFVSLRRRLVFSTLAIN